MNLKRGNFGVEVEHLQNLMNRAGAMLVCDGDFGPGTERGVRYVQDAAGLPMTGVADSALLDWLNGLPDPFPRLDE